MKKIFSPNRREFFLLCATLFCVAIFHIDKGTAGLTAFTVAPLLLLAFFIYQAHLVWVDSKKPVAALLCGFLAWAVSAGAAAFSIQAYQGSPSLCLWLECTIGAAIILAGLSAAVFISKKTRINLYLLIPPVLACMVLASWILTESRERTDSFCRNDICLAAVVSYWPGVSKVAEAPPRVQIELPQ